MNKIIALIVAESEAIHFIKLSLLTADIDEGMTYQLESCFQQSEAFDLYKSLSNEEKAAYYKLMSVMTFIEDLI